MKIRRLEIQGFKSFAERTVLTFGEGITGVVGPNGCGKSNIVDSIRWVMGEQSAKHLRGSGMQDVIFAGSESRGPVGVAEVTITFKNDGALVPPEYARFEEISVTRRLFRDGTSEYAINKVACRLRDILDLFMGTGIGKQAYSIIEQGRIGLIVTAKPEDRRAFIEEAAGISRYKARRKQAERRIEATEQNLLRVTDIVTELKQRIGSLERQAKKAERYKRLKTELRELDLHAAAHRYLELDALERFESETARSLRERIETDEAAIAADEERILTGLERLSEREQDLRARDEKIHEHQQALAVCENGAEFLAREREALSERLAEAEAEQASLSTELVTLLADRASAEDLGRELAETGGEETQSLAEQEQALLELEASIQAKDAELEAEKQAMVSAITHGAQHDNNLATLARLDADLASRLARSEESLSTTAKSLREHEKEAKETRQTLAGTRQLKLALEDRRQAQEALLEKLKGEQVENELTLIASREELIDKRSRLNSLSDLQRSYEGFKDGVRSILKKRDEDEGFARVLHGLVADVVSAEPKYEAAVEAVLGERLQYVIVSSQEAGLSAIEYLKQNAEGRSSFIPLDLREDHASWAPRTLSLRPRVGDASGLPSSSAPMPAWMAVPVSEGSRLPTGHAQSMYGAPDPVMSELPLQGRYELSRLPVAAFDLASPPVGGGRGTREEETTPPRHSTISAPPPAWSALPAPAGGGLGDQSIGSALPFPERVEDVLAIAEDLWPNLESGGVWGKLADLVTAQPGYEHVARVLLGDVVVVEDFPTAQRIWRENGHRKTLVTLSGEVLDPVGVLTGGAHANVSRGILSQKREIKELTEEVRALEGRVKVAEERHATLKQRIADLDRAIKDLSKEGHQEELSIVRLERDLKRLDETIQRLSEERAAHEQEIAAVSEKRASLSAEMDASRAAVRTLDAERAEVEARVIARTQEVNALKETARELAAQVTTLKVTVAANTERREGAERNLARIVHRIGDVEARLAKLEELIESHKTELAGIQDRIHEATEESARLHALISTERGEIAGVREALDAEGRTLREEDAQFRGRRREIDAMKESLRAAQLRMRECEMSRATLLGQIDERYRISLLDVLQEYHLHAPQGDSHRDQIEKLRSQIDNIGAINLTAIDEFNEVNERYTFLSAQKVDLEQAIGSLRAAIKRINKTSKERYVEAFRMVNEKFQQVFPRLFNGGTASLVMLDESDPLESGIEMLAQPPGKKLQSVNLLSGGEKALTAVSLIFGIFLIKPTPFCLLDEVDAPLDEANVGRYNEMLRDMSSVSQFILITHNKRTMELPDRLYGVTMEEPGISKIVPVDIVDERKRKLKAV